MESLWIKFLNLVEKLNSTNGRIEKENILKEYSNDEDIKYIINFVFNPYIVTGISSKKLKKYKDNINEWIEDFKKDLSLDLAYSNELDFLNYFKEHNTGSDYNLKYLSYYASKFTDKEKEIIYSIISKDIKLGIQPLTLNKVFGKGFIETFDVMLAEKYFDNPEKYLPENTNFIITTKLDGVRCVLLNYPEGPKFFSRQGQSIQGLIDLEKEAIEKLPKGWAYDGELLLNKQGLESKDLYRETVKVTGSDNEKRNIIFNCFDILTIDEFKSGYSGSPTPARKERVKLATEDCEWFKNVAILYQGTNQSQIQYWLDKITSEGGEGVMINIADAPYECKRSKGLLKVKKFQTADVHVIGLEEGTGVNQNKLGACIVEFIGPDKKIYNCKVGSGFKLEEREYFWEHKEEILDKIIEINYFEITKNQQNDNYSLRFPTWKGIIRFDKGIDDLSIT